MATLSNNTSNDKSMNGLVTIDANSISTDELDVDTLVVNLEATVPTVSALSNDTHVATTAWVNSHTSGNYVTLAGASQTISSEKTFSNANTFITGALNAPTIKTTLGTSMTIATDPVGYTDDIDITTANDLTLTAGFNAVINCYQGSFSATNFFGFTSNGSAGMNFYENFGGAVGMNFNGTNIKFNNTGGTTIFYAIPSCAIAPTTANHLCNKTYTDSVAGGAGILTTNNTFSGTNAFTNTLNLNATGTATNNIGAAATTTNILGLTYINASGTANTEIGQQAGGVVSIRSPNVLINTAGTTTTNIGNSLSTTYLNGNTTISGLPITLNYSSSSHSETTAATVLTQLGGTFRSTVTWTAWATSTFNYVMNQFIPGVPGWVWPGGYITLAKGSYSFNYAFSFDDGTAYNLTDLRVGISTSSGLTAASSDATIIANLPGNNLTCYKHYVTTITPASTDVVVEQMSGSFYLSASTAIYPFARINNSAAGGINTVKFDLTLTRIGL